MGLVVKSVASGAPPAPPARGGANTRGTAPCTQFLAADFLPVSSQRIRNLRSPRSACSVLATCAPASSAPSDPQILARLGAAFFLALLKRAAISGRFARLGQRAHVAHEVKAALAGLIGAISSFSAVVPSRVIAAS